MDGTWREIPVTGYPPRHHPAAMTRFRRRRPATPDESGSSSLELVISLIFLAVAIGALVSVFTFEHDLPPQRRHLRHRHALVDRQMEVYNSFPYASLKLSAATVPPPRDRHVSDEPACRLSLPASRT